MDTKNTKRVIIRKTKPALSKEQRVGLYLFIVIGSFGVLLGSVYSANQIKVALNADYTGPEVLTAEQRQQQELERLKELDEDGDGLNSYEESYIYKTSRYLADTDGDGVDDPEEIAAGTDPTCAPGADCSGLLQNEFEVSPIDQSGEVAGEALDAIQSGQEDAALIQEALLGISVVEIRSALVENGADPDEVAALTDEQILQIYQESVAELEEEDLTAPVEE